MQTAVAWLLEKLQSEGRGDLVAQYQEKNRTYQRDIAIKQREQRLAELNATFAACADDKSSYAIYISKQIAKQETTLAKLKTER